MSDVKADLEVALADARRGHRLSEWEGVSARLVAAVEPYKARAELLAGRMLEVFKLHVEEPCRCGCGGTICRECAWHWPCDTAIAIGAAE